MPYQGLKPAISKAKERLRGVVRGKKTQSTSSSHLATKHANLSVRGIAQSIKGMVSHKNLDQAANRQHEEKPRRPVHDPVPTVTFLDDLAQDFKNELEIAALTANAAVLNKLSRKANIKKPESGVPLAEYNTVPEYLADHGTRPKWIKTSGADGEPFLLVDPLRMNAPEQIEEDDEEDRDEDGVVFVDKKGKMPVYKA